MRRSPETPAPTTTTTPDAPPDVETTASTGCLLRLYWMFLGNGLLALSAYLITQAHRTLSAADVGFWLIAASLVVARYFDIVRFQGTMADGSPAGVADWRRYAIRTVLITLALWLVAHGLGALIMTGGGA